MSWVYKQKRSPYWYAQWSHPDGSGRRITASTGKLARREAAAAARELERASRASWERARAGHAMPVEAVIARYWHEDASEKRHAKSVAVHLARIERCCGAGTVYANISTRHVSDLVTAMKAERLAPATINRALSVWRRMHTLAKLAWEIPVLTIHWGSVKQTEPEGRTRALTPEQIQGLMDRLPPHAAQVVAFAVVTGVRRAQVLGLTWDRVDLQHRVVTIQRKHRRQRAAQIVPLHDVAMRILRARAKAAGIDVGASGNGQSIKVFDGANFRRLWEGAVSAEGLADVRFHDLRHTCATLHVRNGTPLIVVQRLLGHADIATTQRYAHVSDQDVATRARGLDVDLRVGVE